MTLTEIVCKKQDHEMRLEERAFDLELARAYQRPRHLVSRPYRLPAYRGAR